MNKKATLSPSVSRRDLVKKASSGAAAVGLASALAVNQAPAVIRAQTQIRMITPAALGLERELYQTFIDEFVEATGIQVELSFEAWDDYLTRLPTLFAGGAVPDVIHQHMSIVHAYGSRGVLEDLGPYMDQADISQDSYIPALFEAFSHNTEVRAFPKDSAAWGIYYNKTKFDEAGIEYPSFDWTFEEFRETARALTIDGAGRRGTDADFSPGNDMQQWGMSWVQPGPVQSENVRGFIRARGGDWYDDAVQHTLISDTPAIEHFSMFHEMRCVEQSLPTDALAEGQGDPFRQGLTAMVVGFHSVDFFLREEGAEFEWGVTFIPKGDGGQFVPVGASGWAIPSGSEKKEAAWELVQYLVSPDVQRRIGLVGRWGVSYQDAIPTIIPENPVDGFTEVHVDPLVSVSDEQTPIGFKFPPQQSEIQQVYATYFDPVWACDTDDIEGAAAAAKQEIDEILAEEI